MGAGAGKARRANVVSATAEQRPSVVAMPTGSGHQAETLPASLGDAIIAFGGSTIKDKEGEIVVEWLRQPEVADGRCRLSAESFALLLNEEGLDAAAECQDDEEPPYGKAWGYDDRTKNSGWGNHWLTVVKLDGQTYTIDFAAAQFGYSQFPLVQRFVNGEWRRL